MYLSPLGVVDFHQIFMPVSVRAYRFIRFLTFLLGFLGGTDFLWNLNSIIKSPGFIIYLPETIVSILSYCFIQFAGLFIDYHLLCF